MGLHLLITSVDMSGTQRSISIWFFIGALLGVYGILILGAGIYNVFVPPNVALKEYHAGIWWGAILIAIGAFYTIRFRPRPEKPSGEGERRSEAAAPTGGPEPRS